TLGLGLLGEGPADLLRRLDVAAVGLGVLALRQPTADVGERAAGRREGGAAEVVDELGVNVLGAAEEGQPRPLGRPGDLPPHVPPPAQLPLALRLLVVHVCLPPTRLTAGWGERRGSSPPA